MNPMARFIKRQNVAVVAFIELDTSSVPFLGGVEQLPTQIHYLALRLVWNISVKKFISIN